MVLKTITSKPSITLLFINLIPLNQLFFHGLLIFHLIFSFLYVSFLSPMEIRSLFRVLSISFRFSFGDLWFSFRKSIDFFENLLKIIFSEHGGSGFFDGLEKPIPSHLSSSGNGGVGGLVPLLHPLQFGFYLPVVPGHCDYIDKQEQ